MAITTTADAIAAALREHLRDRITYLPDRKIHALLYLALGLRFAANDEPLFTDEITATADGVQVGTTTDTARAALDDVQHAVVMLTASRYGGLSAMDLEALIRGQTPWAKTEAGHAIHPDLIRQQFRTQDEIPEGTVSGFPRRYRNPAGRSIPHRDAPPDDPAEIAAFAAEVRARM